jgi:hypothetical protein
MAIGSTIIMVAIDAAQTYGPIYLTMIIPALFVAGIGIFYLTEEFE